MQYVIEVELWSDCGTNTTVYVTRIRWHKQIWRFEYTRDVNQALHFRSAENAQVVMKRLQNDLYHDYSFNIRQSS